MPPVAAPERTTTNNNDGWQERTSPELYKFEREGDEVIGFLRHCIKEQAEGKLVPTYFIENDEHKIIKIRATYDLLQKLSSRDIGMRIRIRLEGTQQTTAGTMMKFAVWVKPGPRSQNNPEITDEDIGF